jgi:apolipoprotein N-acyltransferase
MSLNKKGAFVIFLIAAIIILSYLYRPQNQPGTKKISYAIIQTDEASAIDQPAKVKLDDFKIELAFLNQIAKQSPKSQLILFPEASDFLKNISAFLTTAQAEKYFDDLFPDSRLIISGSRVIDTNNKTVSRVFALDTKNGIIGYYDKRLLTPGGEFLPYAFKFALNLSAKGKISAFGQAREFSIGENKKTNFALGGKFTVAPVVCSEIMSPDIVRKNSNGKDVIVAMASMAIYHGAKDNISEVLAVSRFRAAENQKPLLLSANMGLSYAIDGRGVVQKITTDEQPQILTGDMDIGQGKSWYNGYGDWPALIAAGLGVVALIFMNKKHVKSS